MPKGAYVVCEKNYMCVCVYIYIYCKERTPVRTTFSLFWANAQGLQPSFELTTNLEEPVPSLVAAQARNTPDHLMRMHAFPDIPQYSVSGQVVVAPPGASC